MRLRQVVDISGDAVDVGADVLTRGHGSREDVALGVGSVTMMNEPACLCSDKPLPTLPRTRLNLLCFDGRLVTTAASSGRRPRVKHRNIQQQNTKR